MIIQYYDTIFVQSIDSATPRRKVGLDYSPLKVYKCIALSYVVPDN